MSEGVGCPDGEEREHGATEIVVGIDLGGTNCRGALVSSSGELGEFHRMSTRIEEGLEPFFSRLLFFCREFLAEAQARGDRVCAVGLGVPGVIAADGSVTVSPNLSALDGVPLALRLRESLGVPVTLVNDANAISWGEALFGAGRPFASFLTLTLGTGVGGGLILGNRLWEGADGAAGEAGHIMVEPDGPPCGCGSRGCLEQYASASGIARTVRGRLAGGATSLLRAEEAITSHDVSVAARAGDAVALDAFKEAGTRLGQALAGIANLLNLEGVVITGGAAESLDLMLPHLRRELECRAFEVPARRLAIVKGELGDDAGILGAARLAFDRLSCPVP